MQEHIDRISQLLEIEQKEASVIYEKAELGSEITRDFDFNSWFENRYKNNIVFIDEVGYSKMCIDALKIVNTTAGTDYGSSRQRDLGQLWSDMTRGYLAEYAFGLFLKQKFNIDSKLGHDKGNLQTYLPNDIAEIKIGNEKFRKPNLNIGIKGSKWNGIWLDIPGSQFHHSDIHVFVKVGTGRDHLFAFFKHLSVFKDKVLKKGVEVGSITEIEADELYNELPIFKPIPAYIVGFAETRNNYPELNYSGKKGRKNFKINTWQRQIKSGDLMKIKKIEFLSENAKIEFLGIGEFSHENGYLFNTGNLKWELLDWQKSVINKL